MSGLREKSMADITQLYPPLCIPIVMGVALLYVLALAGLRKHNADGPEDASNSTSNNSPSTRPMTNEEGKAFGWMGGGWDDD